MTTHRPPSTVHRPPSILLAIILFIILRNPMPTMAHNHLAIHTIAACPGHATSQPTYDHTTWPQAWLAAALAHCQGNTTQARIAWQQVITHTNARLQAIRAALPDDLPLAQLAATQHPTSATAHFWHGAALTTHLTNQQTHQSSNHQTIQQAIHAYQTALTLQPTAATAWRQFGDLYRDHTDDWQSAAAAYDQACFRFDRGGNGCLRAGALYNDHHQYQLAADRYQRSLNQIPDFPRAHRGLATALLALGHTQEALPHLQTLATNGDTWAQEQLELLTIDDKR